MITRHFIDVGGRRVHYRRAGSGPPLLMVHQSPRSSAEYATLMTEWSTDFTCIAPDTPGFGESDPLPGAPEIDDFADALVALLDTLGLGKVAAYGFHSGAIILMAALRRAPRRFTALALGGYAVWTPEEMAIFGERYLPPFQPSGYGEHLTWLWNRVLEQSWFFPWFDTSDPARLGFAHADPLRVQATVDDLLASGDAYRAGYGAVLRAPRDLPPPDAVVPPVLLTAFDGDPLQPHLARLGSLPAGWSAHPVATPAAHHAASRDFLRAHPAPLAALPSDTRDAGFVPVATPGFTGLLHWRGERPSLIVRVAGPGRAAALLQGPGLLLDPPGHGLSDDWPGDPPTLWEPWRAAIDAAVVALGGGTVEYEGIPAGDPARLFPALAPDRFGHHLTDAWAIVRAAHLFEPWYEVSPTTARAFDPAALDPAALAREHRARLRAGPSARAYAIARRAADAA